MESGLSEMEECLGVKYVIGQHRGRRSGESGSQMSVAKRSSGQRERKEWMGKRTRRRKVRSTFHREKQQRRRNSGDEGVGSHLIIIRGT